MADFYQNGVITTLHNLKHRSVDDMEQELLELGKNRPMGLIIPCLYSELDGQALPKIVEELKHVPYLDEIVIGLDRANTKKEFNRAKEFFNQLPQHHRILWNDGPRLQKLNKLLHDRKLAPYEMGKGRNAWFCFGYMNSSEKSEAIALHDADIVTYDRGMLARLFYPVVNPNFRYRFCKGFYYRATQKELKGRVVRLLVYPLLISLRNIFGYYHFIEYLNSFRYPLAGEFSMRADVIKTIRIPSDWGLEIGFLSEVHRNNSTARICQVEISDRYDHKHQPTSPENAQKGLSKMSLDISKSIFRKLASNGVVFSAETFRTIKATYYRIAQDLLEQYHSDAIMNGFIYSRNDEEEIVDSFAQNIYNAGMDFLSNPMQTAFIPSWKRVMNALPDYLQKFHEAVELDNQ